MQESIGTPWLWAGFVAFVLTMLVLDLGVFHKKDHEISVREALAYAARVEVEHREIGRAADRPCPR